jgi:hypothetical protein
MKTLSASIIVLSGAICLSVSVAVPPWEYASEVHRAANEMSFNELTERLPLLIGEMSTMQPHFWGSGRSVLAVIGAALLLIGVVSWTGSFCRSDASRLAATRELIAALRAKP